LGPHLGGVVLIAALVSRLDVVPAGPVSPTSMLKGACLSAGGMCTSDIGRTGYLNGPYFHQFSEVGLNKRVILAKRPRYQIPSPYNARYVALFHLSVLVLGSAHYDWVDCFFFFFLSAFCCLIRELARSRKVLANSQKKCKVIASCSMKKRKVLAAHCKPHPGTFVFYFFFTIFSFSFLFISCILFHDFFSISLPFSLTNPGFYIFHLIYLFYLI
jgi:hypothetical protein